MRFRGGRFGLEVTHFSVCSSKHVELVLQLRVSRHNPAVTIKCDDRGGNFHSLGIRSKLSGSCTSLLFFFTSLEFLVAEKMNHPHYT